MSKFLPLLVPVIYYILIFTIFVQSIFKSN